MLSSIRVSTSLRPAAPADRPVFPRVPSIRRGHHVSTAGCLAMM